MDRLKFWSALVAVVVLFWLYGCAEVPKHVADQRLIMGYTETCLAGSVSTWDRVDCGTKSRLMCQAANLETNCGIDWGEDKRRPW